VCIPSLDRQIGLDVPFVWMGWGGGVVCGGGVSYREDK